MWRSEVSKHAVKHGVFAVSTPRRAIPTVLPKATMSQENAQNPLHGITLENLLIALVDHYGWEKLGQLIDIRCFQSDPSIKSSLKFLRKTPWAREKVEALFVKL